MTARKTPSERANVNARAALSTRRTLAAQLRVIDLYLTSNGFEIERGTLEALQRAAFQRGHELASAELLD